MKILCLQVIQIHVSFYSLLTGFQTSTFKKGLWILCFKKTTNLPYKIIQVKKEFSKEINEEFLHSTVFVFVKGFSLSK